MPATDSAAPHLSFATLGDLLRYLRRRAGLTQRELSIAVGYSEAQISRLEQNQRLPDLAALAAQFIPALHLEDEPELAAQMLEMAAAARGEAPPVAGLTITRTVAHEIFESVEPTGAAPAHNLPLHLTSFVGRVAEMAEIERLLAVSRLVTLTGPGGGGKTRLAQHVAAGLLPAFPDGAWFVDLAPLAQGELVAPLAAGVLGVPGDATAASLAGALHDMRLLVILDNCEQVIESCAQLADTLLRACPHLKMLATSREALEVPGEVAYPVPSLSTPDRQRPATVEALGQYEATRLFVERAAAARPGFAPTDANAPAIAQVCRELDGIPLAIELAAARVRALSVEEIAGRLADRLGLLTAGSRIARPRHQTLRALIDWSWELLPEPERAVLRRLSVFAGGFNLASAEGVIGNWGIEVEAAPSTTLDLIAQLVNKSLVTARPLPGATRYSLLETIREYAREKLRAAGEEASLRESHFDYFAGLSREAESEQFGAESSLDWAEAELDNLRAALAWSLEADPAGSARTQDRSGRGLELFTNIWQIWIGRGYSSEGSHWVEQLLAAHTAPTLARARGFLMASDFARFRGDYGRAKALAQKALALSRELGDEQRIGWSLMELGLAEVVQHEYARAAASLSQAVDVFRDLSDDLWLYRTTFLLANVYVVIGDLAAAQPLWEAGLRWARRQSDPWHTSWGLEGLGNIARLDGRLDQAAAYYAESLKLKLAVKDKLGLHGLIEGVAQLAAARQQPEPAATLWGAADQLRQSIHVLPDPALRDLYTSHLPAVREQLGEADFAAAWAGGELLAISGLDYVVEFALAVAAG